MTWLTYSTYPQAVHIPSCTTTSQWAAWKNTGQWHLLQLSWSVLQEYAGSYSESSAICLLIYQVHQDIAAPLRYFLSHMEKKVSYIKSF